MNGRFTVTVPQVARLLGVGTTALYAAIARGEAPVPVLHIGRRVVVSVAEVARVLGIDGVVDGRPLTSEELLRAAGIEGGG